MMTTTHRIQKHRQSYAMRRLLSVIILSVFLLIIALLIRQHHSAFIAEADAEPQRYMSIQIEEGDSLWSIASEYKSDTTDIKHYINTVRELNNIKGSEIYASQYLIIPIN